MKIYLSKAGPKGLHLKRKVVSHGNSPYWDLRIVTGKWPRVQATNILLSPDLCMINLGTNKP
jgi:hypothetical protein